MHIKTFIPVTSCKPDVKAKYQVQFFQKQLLSANRYFDENNEKSN